jgi:hypothetical protein
MENPLAWVRGGLRDGSDMYGGVSICNRFLSDLSDLSNSFRFEKMPEMRRKSLIFPELHTWRPHQESNLD